jgi:hypothetical protein
MYFSKLIIKINKKLSSINSHSNFSLMFYVVLLPICAKVMPPVLFVICYKFNYKLMIIETEKKHKWQILTDLL